MYGNPIHNTARITILDFRLQETGTFNDQFHRPLEAVIRHDAIENLAGRVNQAIHSNSVGTVHADLLAGMADGIITVSATPDRRAGIVNGWNERRFRFTMTVQIEGGFGSEICYFQGYSEYFDISHAGSIDPNLVFYINSYTSVSRTTDPMNPNGGYIDRVRETRQVLNGAYGANEAPQLYGARPEDLFIGIQGSYISQGIETGMPIADTRINLRNQTFANSRMNAVPAATLASVINTHRRAQTVADFGHGAENVYDRMIQLIHERSPMENKFIAAISSIQNDGYAASVFFTLETLLKIDPTVLSRTGYTPLEDLSMVSHAGGNHCDWSGSDKASQIAYLAATTTSAIMQACGMVTVHFHATNMTLTGETISAMTAPSILYSNSNAEATWQLFLTRFTGEVMPDLTASNLIPISVTIDADVFNETRIVLSIDGGPEVLYVFPAFADSLLQPNFTTNEANYHSLLTGVEYVLQATGIGTAASNLNAIAEV